MYSKKEDLVTLAKQSKKLPNFIWATILAFLFMTGGQIIGGICIIPLYIILSFFHSISSNLKILELFIQLSSFVFISILVFVRVKYIEKRSISTLGFSKDSWLKKYIKGFIIGLVMMVIVVLILCLFGCVSVEKNPSQPIGISAIGGVMLILVGWIIQGGTEEIVTRGWLMNVLAARYNKVFGLILSSTIFGLMHLFNPDVNYVAVINIILVGLFYGIYVTKTNDLWAVCGMHSAWNFAQGNIFGFEVSGLNVGVSSIVDLNLVGSDTISGGTFGPEAGLIATFVLISSIAIVFILDKKGYFTK
ncbi:hypothetical protein TPDSL_19470 [Terrisporobacter petrolearius]|uniref:CPBP family intramembrane glutamic endopeptidase n=1 Tax=Terrisporobacter petrolearius TaxID=1460447 RepID=UPI0033660E03